MGLRRAVPLVVVLVTTRHHLDALSETLEEALQLITRPAGLLDRAITRSIRMDAADHTPAIRRLSEDAWTLHADISRVISDLEEVTPDD